MIAHVPGGAPGIMRSDELKAAMNTLINDLQHPEVTQIRITKFAFSLMNVLRLDQEAAVLRAQVEPEALTPSEVRNNCFCHMCRCPLRLVRH